jgi:hypothetical protein
MPLAWRRVRSAAGYASPISLGVNAPPSEVGPDPLGRDGLESFAGKPPDFFESLPWILGALQALDSSGCSFFCCVCHR